jgi:AraC family transcriptional activator FtrA
MGERKHRVAIVVVEGTMALDTAVAVQAFGPRPQVFSTMRDETESPYELVLCGDPSSQLGTIGFSLGGLQPIEAVATADTVVVPGVGTPLQAREQETLAAITAAGERGARLVSFCGGAFVLAQAGVLRGHRATTHWALADEFRSLHPDVTLVDDDLYVEDRGVFTSGGMLAATDLCLHLLRSDHGQSYANDMSRLLVSPPHRTGGQSQYRHRKATPMQGSLAPLMAWALEHLDDDLTVPVLAAQGNMSTRTLTRKFEAETGGGALKWVMERRVERARALLEDSDLNVTDIAFRTGFGSLATFRRQFHAVTGTTPLSYRQTFAGASVARSAAP